MCYKIEKSSFETDERGGTTTAKERVVKSENYKQARQCFSFKHFRFQFFSCFFIIFFSVEKKQSKKDKNLVPSGQSINLDASAHNRVTGLGPKLN